MYNFSRYSDKLSESIKKKIDLSNRVNAALIIIFITIFFIDLGQFLFTDVATNTDFIRSVSAILICSVNIFLNRFGLFQIGRFLLLYLLPNFLLLEVVLTGNVSNDYYFWFQYLPVAISVVPYYLFSEKKEKKWLFLTLGYYLLLILITDNVLNYFSNQEPSIVSIIKENQLFYKIAPAFIFIFLNITLYHVFKVSSNYEKGLVRAKKKLNKKNVELKKKNAELNKINATKNKFFRIISHDLRAPVAQIIQIANLLEDRTNKLSRSDNEKIVKALKKSSLLGYNLLNDLFNWAQTQTGEIVFAPVTLNIYNLINDNIQLLLENASYKNIEVVNSVSKNYTAFADMNMLNTIVRNLLSNAIKFTYHGGKIEINDKIKTDGIEISIQDNGKGISDNDLAKLFKIETKISSQGTDGERGTGIGLVLCKEFIGYHKGKIWVESEVEKGSKFTFFLPAKI